ncbi:hypothetical protein D3C84_1167380 [compost metagenome]
MGLGGGFHHGRAHVFGLNEGERVLPPDRHQQGYRLAEAIKHAQGLSTAEFHLGDAHLVR